ncbi:hypothetical protein [Paenibacillus bouchesdurhonensis]|uniref:hypothetical protein n=1 Tax=Paenibacillus bouchesdurhonensis TaxID=1870990 RepID=UPI0019011070|nr:hypothetical protein [Paenibacillus bouchesdurhonensis]
MLNRIKTLARNQCANFCGSNGCRIEPNGQPRCNFYRDDPQAAPFIEAGTIRCLYFEHAVLPVDLALSDAYYAADSEPGAKCVTCGLPFARRSNRQRYCPSCAQARRRELDRARKGRKTAD